MEKTILLIDGSSFIFRAFYAIRELTAPNGTPTNAIYGMINMLKQMQKKFQTPYWVCVFDSSGKTFRDEIYPEYKATRRETPAELKVQFNYIYDIIAKLGIPVIIENGVEADDVIGTIAKKYAEFGYKIIIATGDKDFAQIVDEQITLVNTMTNEILDTKGVINKFGVRPDQIIDYLSLVGDTVDNVPGIHKCGPKTAQKWLNEYQDIPTLIQNQDKLTGVVGDNFRKAANWLATAQQLIKIDTNVNVSTIDISNIKNLAVTSPKYEQLIPIFKELNFRTWLRESEEALKQHQAELIEDTFPIMDISDKKTKQKNIILKKHIKLSELNSIVNLIKEITINNLLTAFTLITADYTDPSSPLEAISISNQSYVYTIYLQQKKKDELFSTDTNTKELIECLKIYLTGLSPKICVNLKNTLRILACYQIQPMNICGDLSLASYIKASNDNHSLAAIINRISEKEVFSEEEICGKGAKRLSWELLSDEQQDLITYNLNEPILEIHSQIINSLDKQELVIYRDLELPLTNLLFQMETYGMLIDSRKFELLSFELKNRLQQLETEIFNEANTVFNINSPKQLQDILFNQLKLPTAGLKSNTTGFSTDEETLTTLADLDIKIAKLLLEYRMLNKLLNTYVDKLPLAADKNNRLHTSLEQTVVTSGRLSSKDPNLQNIPVRNEYGQKIRECFIAEPGHKLVCADYSQIELRILAHISGDENLIEAFKNGLDIHSATASQIFHKQISEVTKDERRYAKTINFGLIYGKSVFGLAKELKIERIEAKTYIDNYFAKYPKVKTYMEKIKQQAHQDGYVTTIYGRKIYLANINSSNNILRQAEERLALNAPMQGSAADIIKIAMLNVSGWLEANNMASKLIMQVHDELIFQVPDKEVDLIMNNLSRLMTEAIKITVPLEVEVNFADNWAEAH